MRRLRTLLVACALAASPALAEWRFDAPLDVSGEARPQLFPHLDAAGRRSLAVTRDRVAVVWEDSRTGEPQAYVAVKARGDAAFGEPLRVSRKGEAFAPAVAGLPDGRFLMAWEEAECVWVRLFDAERPGPALELEPGSQITVAEGPAGAFAAWVRPAGAHGQIVVARLDLAGHTPRLLWARPVEATPPQGGQLYPALAATDSGLVVGWEDRRHGHTRVYTARLAGEDFTPPAALNEISPEPAAFGRGTGVTRLALAAVGDLVAATWMDKRDFQGGYDTYAAVSTDAGRSFGPNELVQDLFGANQPQWHPAVAVGPDGQIAVVWDDPRDGNPDLWLSWRQDGGWSDDLAVPGAHGPGEQDNPAIAFDAQGAVHLAWVERGEAGMRIRYVRGRLEP